MGKRIKELLALDKVVRVQHDRSDLASRLEALEILQEGEPLPVKEPWASMPNTGTW